MINALHLEDYSPALTTSSGNENETLQFGGTLSGLLSIDNREDFGIKRPMKIALIAESSDGLSGSDSGKSVLKQGLLDEPLRSDDPNKNKLHDSYSFEKADGKNVILEFYHAADQGWIMEIDLCVLQEMISSQDQYYFPPLQDAFLERSLKGEPAIIIAENASSEGDDDYYNEHEYDVVFYLVKEGSSSHGNHDLTIRTYVTPEILTSSAFQDMCHEWKAEKPETSLHEALAL